MANSGTTARQVALLRGVNNVGKASRVAMADLRVLFTDLGFRAVHTLLNSGNVVFTAGSRRGDVAGRIEKALATKLGVNASVIVLSGDEVIAIVHENPLARIASNPSRLLVVVPKQPADLKQLEGLLEKSWAPDVLALGTRAAYLWCPDGVGQSVLWPAVERVLKRSCTARNIATMTKLSALVQEPT